MYTLVALALRYQSAPDKDLEKPSSRPAWARELTKDRRSKEIIIMAPGVEGATDPD